MAEELDKDKPLFTISTISEMLGVSPDTLRLYEREGLIIPFKKESSHRLYSYADIERLKCIRNLIKENKINIAGINAMLSLIPCWDIISCSKTDRENCDSYKGNFRPCWSYKHINNICAKFDCRECKVYKEYFTCDTIKNKLQKIIK